MAASAPAPSLFDKHTARAEWNTFYESRLHEKYHSPTANPLHWSQAHPELNLLHLLARTEIEDTPKYSQDSYRIHETSAGLSPVLSDAVDEAFLKRGFEAAWRALPAARKEEILLEGIFRASCWTCRELIRLYCPELIVAHLAGEGEYSLLGILRSRVGRPRQPEFNHHFNYGRVLGIEIGQGVFPPTLTIIAHGGELATERNVFIMQVLLSVLDVFYGRPAPAYCASPVAEEAHRERAVKPVCYVCNAWAADEGIKISVCSGCRRASYCSPACQALHWPQHKRICKRSGGGRPTHAMFHQAIENLWDSNNHMIISERKPRGPKPCLDHCGVE